MKFYLFILSIIVSINVVFSWGMWKRDGDTVKETVPRLPNPEDYVMKYSQKRAEMSRYDKFSRDYIEDLKGVSIQFFHKKTCRYKCFWPRYSAAIWMPSGSTCTEEVGIDDIKARNSFALGDVCSASVST